MPRDYYDILGVSRDAEAGAIKKAYRKLAKKYHPDVNKDPGAPERFAEAQEAYDVLSDAQKRKRYDRFGHAGVNAQAAGGAGGGGHRTYGTPGGFNFGADDLGQDFTIDDIFSQFFKGGGRGGSGGASAGGGPVGAGAQRRRRSVRGRDIEHAVTIPFDRAVRGGTITIKIAGPDGPQTLDVKIPTGVADGGKLRLRGKGEASPSGGPAGDLLLTLRVSEHPYFRRQGLDLYVDVPISIDEAVFGASVEAPTLAGKASLKVPAGAGSGRKLRLRGAGIENASGEKGDIYAVLRIDVPKELTEEQREVFEQLRGKLPDPRRDTRW